MDVGECVVDVDLRRLSLQKGRDRGTVLEFGHDRFRVQLLEETSLCRAALDSEHDIGILWMHLAVNLVCKFTKLRAIAVGRGVETEPARLRVRVRVIKSFSVLPSTDLALDDHTWDCSVRRRSPVR
jgi:hypothetical protein